MKIEELKELLEFVSERNIAELELEEAGTRIKIRKAIASTHSEPPAASSPTPGKTTETTSAPLEAAATSTSNQLEDGLLYVTSPMVGTFYRQPEPGAEPFTREGDYVKKGQVLCIIEAMKLMNEIECELEGQLVKVLVENGQPVQYGDQLFAIRSV
ncbi:MAG: acetyl-CoA carboxylase biotin carboxyl carrier protein [Vicinamibacteria bacterium]